MHDLNQTTVETWFAREAGRQAASSFNKVRMRVAGFLGFCQRRGWLTQDLLAEVRPRRVVQRERLRLSAQELRRLYETAENPRDRAMLAIACNTGLRASDLVALRIGDVDLDQGLLRVVARKTGRLDYLPITADLDSELRRWLTWYAERRALQDGFLLTPALAYRVRRGEQYGDPEPDRPLAHPARVVHKGLAQPRHARPAARASIPSGEVDRSPSCLNRRLIPATTPRCGSLPRCSATSPWQRPSFTWGSATTA